MRAPCYHRAPLRSVRAFLLALAFVVAPQAWAQSERVAVVDVVEIAGPIDRPIERYAIERIDAAERDGAALVVFQVDSLGGLKAWGDEEVPPLVDAIRDAAVPVAVWIGPRNARAAGLALWIAEAANVAAAGPSARLGPAHPADAIPRVGEEATLFSLAHARGRTAVFPIPSTVLGANEALRRGLIDLVVPSVAELLRRVDGRTVVTAAGVVALRLPSDGVDVRFHQPGPIRRMLHAFANPALVYVLLLGAALLVVFELFQPGFGVAGVTGALLGAAAVYGLTVLPARWPGLALLCAGLALLTLDVAVHGLGLPTIAGSAGLVAGSLMLFPGAPEHVTLRAWLIALGSGSALVFFVPVMTFVRRARHPIATDVRRALVGEPGDVRSVLNPEGFVWVGGELWRARSEDGSRMRVGEPVVVSAVEGTLLIVRGPGNGSAAERDGSGETGS